MRQAAVTVVVVAISAITYSTIKRKSSFVNIAGKQGAEGGGIQSEY